jgi:predicted nucleic acid-binding protein
MLVIDASVIVKIFVEESSSPEAIALYRSGQPLLVPAHAFAEAGEVFSRKLRNRFVDDAQLSLIISELRETSLLWNC